MEAQVPVSMQVPATPPAVHACGAAATPPGPHCPKSSTIDWSLSHAPPGPMSFSICRSCARESH